MTAQTTSASATTTMTKVPTAGTNKSGVQARYTKEELYNLLPAVYRQRDIELAQLSLGAGQDPPLKALLGVIAEQVGIIEDDIQNLYDNWFIETCDAWVVPYIGDLVGATFIHPGTTIGSSIPGTIDRRAFVANTVSYRKRKGTLLVLEQLSGDVTGWGAKAVEFFQNLGWTQCFNHTRLSNLRTPDIRKGGELQDISTPFDTATRTLEVRDIRAGEGRYNIPNVAVFLWRLQAFQAGWGADQEGNPIEVPAHRAGERKYTFSPIGLDTQLFNNPAAVKKSKIDENAPRRSAKSRNLPVTISRLDLYRHPEDYYYSSVRADNSIMIRLNGQIIQAGDIVACDLTGWKRAPPDGKVAVDPVLGRIAFASILPASVTTAASSAPATSPPSGDEVASFSPPPGDEVIDVHVNYFYGFSGEVGGGFYQRPVSDIVNPMVYSIARTGADAHPTLTYKTIPGAADQWAKDGKPDAVFNILDNENYPEPFEIELPRGCNLELRAEQQRRPIIRIEEDDYDGPKISGEREDPSNPLPRANVTFNGLLFEHSPLTIEDGDLGILALRHCTFPPHQLESVNVAAGNDNLVIKLDHTITGGIDTYSVQQSEATLEVCDSIVDEGSRGTALNCYEVKVKESTIFGAVEAEMIDLASNSIFMNRVRVRRRQEGCIRFCFVPDGSKTPRKYGCQPSYPAGSSESVRAAIAMNLKPRFTSKKYGDPGYAQLHKSTPREISRGADDQNEMGVFNQLQQADRLANLKAALAEYTRFGLETGVFLES